MSDAPDFSCGIIHDALDTIPTPIGFRDAISGIRSGRWATLVETVRTAYAQGGKEHASGPKKKLPGILFSGTFTRRAVAGLSHASGLICADLDELKDSVETWFEQITADPHTLACFRSPSGSGLKVIFRCDPARDHKDSYLALEHYMLEHFGLQIDEKCSDISRICFVSHDREMFEADDAEVIPYPPAQPPTEYRTPVHRNGTDLQPGEDFNLRGAGEVPQILLNAGWVQGHGKMWRRPGKREGQSASWDYIPNTLIVFSSSPETGFPSERKGFDPFAIYTHLQHGGDFTQAARTLGQQGYGTPAKLKKETPAPQVQSPPDTPDARLAKKLALIARRVKTSSPPPEPVTRLFLAEKPICTAGNITTITSKAKTGKTATTGAAVAAIISAAAGTAALKPDTFKFRASNPEGHAVIILDTEQSPFDAYQCYRRSLERAGQQDDPAWLHHYSLVGMNARELHDALDMALEIAQETHGGIFLGILDGVADFVNSVNDEAESNQFEKWLRARTVTYNFPCICVIHSNEGDKAGNDSRGHLGKQLIRKAESNLLLKKSGEVTTITSDKQRKAPITEADQVAFQWNEEQQRHASCDSVPQSGKAGRKTKYDSDFMLTGVPGPDDLPLSANQIHRAVAALPCSIDIRTFKDWIVKWMETGEVVRSGDNKSGWLFKRPR